MQVIFGEQFDAAFYEFVLQKKGGDVSEACMLLSEPFDIDNAKKEHEALCKNVQQMEELEGQMMVAEQQ